MAATCSSGWSGFRTSYSQQGRLVLTVPILQHQLQPLAAVSSSSRAYCSDDMGPSWSRPSYACRTAVAGPEAQPVYLATRPSGSCAAGRPTGACSPLVLAYADVAPPAGSLVLGQRQGCLGGCFSPDASLTGDLADVRIWSVARSQVGMLPCIQLEAIAACSRV